jgi:hypothetical protein
MYYLSQYYRADFYSSQYYRGATTQPVSADINLNLESQYLTSGLSSEMFNIMALGGKLTTVIKSSIIGGRVKGETLAGDYNSINITLEAISSDNKERAVSGTINSNTKGQKLGESLLSSDIISNLD